MTTTTYDAKLITINGQDYFEEPGRLTGTQHWAIERDGEWVAWLDLDPSEGHVRSDIAAAVARATGGEVRTYQPAPLTAGNVLEVTVTVTKDAGDDERTALPAPKTDRVAIRAILALLVESGYRLTGCEERERNEWPLTPDSVADFLAENLDEGNVYLRDAVGNRVRLFFVLGEWPGEVLADFAAPTYELLDELSTVICALTDRWSR